MANLNTELVSAFEAYIQTQGLAKGQVAVSIEVILNDFQQKNITLPVTKAWLGRQLTKHFYKKQSKETLNQCYFLNKSI